MASDDRRILEEIAADMIYLSMGQIGTEYAEILAAAAALTDEDLITFITR